MSRISTRACFGQDWDDLLAYSTVKIARIRDRRLGILHYLFMIGIFIYIVGWVIIKQQHYLETEPPFGTVRATIQEPLSVIAPENLPYCLQNQSGTYDNGKFFRNNACVYLHGFDVQFESGARNQLFATTRIKDTVYPAPTQNCTDPPSTPACFAVSSYLPTRQYIADIEDYTVFLEHEVYGQVTGVVARNLQCDGKVIYKNGSVYYLEPNRVADIFTVRNVLEWAGMSTLDVQSQLGVNSNNTLRYDGATIVILVQYQNRRTHNSANDLKYAYSAVQIDGLDVLAAEESFVNAQGQRVQRSRHGVALLFLITGTIGVFSFPTLLLSLVSGFVLLSLATTIVDIMLQYILPERAAYKALKVDISGDFSEKREAAAKGMELQ